jgi:hypothetical protein
MCNFAANINIMLSRTGNIPKLSIFNDQNLAGRDYLLERDAQAYYIDNYVLPHAREVNIFFLNSIINLSSKSINYSNKKSAQTRKSTHQCSRVGLRVWHIMTTALGNALSVPPFPVPPLLPFTHFK